MKPHSCKTRCGYCCTLRVRLKWLDILRIMRAGYKKKDFVVRGSDGKRYIKMIGNKCFFLEKKNKKPSCKIYEHRPRVCRLYPHLRGYAQNCSELKKTFKKLI